MTGHNVKNMQVSPGFLQRLAEQPGLAEQLGFKEGGGGGSFGDMEQRIARLEAHAEHAQLDLTAIKQDIRESRDRLTRLEVKVDHLPSKGFIVAATTAGVGLLSAVISLAVAYQDFLFNLVSSS